MTYSAATLSRFAKEVWDIVENSARETLPEEFLTGQKSPCPAQDAIKLCVGLSVYFGIPWKDLLFATLAGIGEPKEILDSPFQISSESLIIRPGHPYYPFGARAFDETTVKLPLLHELRALATSLISVAEPGDSLHSLIGRDPSDQVRSYVRSVCSRRKTSRRDLASGLHLPFVTLAIDRLGEAPTIVSLLRCNPVPMLRGECAYLVESKQVIAATLIRIQNAIRSLPGLGSESRRSLAIGSDGWLLTIIVLQSLFLAGPSTDRAPVGTLRLQMNFLTLLSLPDSVLANVEEAC